MSQRSGRILIAILLLAAAGDLWAQGCSQCGSTLGEGDPLTRSISRSVVLMASMPFALFVTVAGWLAWKLKGARAARQENPLDGNGRLEDNEG